ncbi:hypothetical protein R3P38DRAFT_3601092 [Favolaschia claudopus]|uniref:Uncharacterized protein n=1 Tax=Favolaschia claudopus TaxID=2862362 RepID=A0AAW0ACI5_9AGAR
MQDFEAADTLCFLCGHPYTAHTVEDGVIAPQNLPFARGGTLDGSGPHRPVTAFAGLHRPSMASVQHTRPSSSTSIAASVHAERRASIQRNLHPNDSNGSTSPSTPRKRKSGPPRPYSDQPAAPLADFATTSTATGLTPITVCILPKVLESSLHNDPLDLSPRYSFKSSAELESVQNALNRANLVFTVDVGQSGPIFEAIDIAFEEHCQLYNIDFVPFHPVPAVKTPNTTSWVLLGPKGRSGGRTWIEDPKSLTRFTFTLQAISTSPFIHTPNHLAEGPCIIIGCVTYMLLWIHYSSRETVFLSMFLFTHASVDVSFIRFLLHSAAIRSPYVPPCAHPPALLRSPPMFKLPPELHLQTYSAPLIATKRFVHDDPVPSVLRSDNGDEISRVSTAVTTPSIVSASTVNEAAQALVTAVFWLCAGRPTGLKFKEILNEQFSLNFPRPKVDGPVRSESAFLGLQVSIRTSDPLTSAVGKGPRNETVALAVRMLLADGLYWIERENHLTLRLHPSRAAIPLRACTLRATGFIFLLHFFFIGAPLPVSPFLFSTMFDGRHTAAKFDLEFLTRFMSPDSLKIVKLFHYVPLDNPLYTMEEGGDLRYHCLLNLPETDLTMISSPRSQAEQDGIVSTIISHFTLGTVDITNRPEFRILEDGFNMCVDAFGGQDRPHHILEWFATPCKELIVSSFDREIKNAAELLSHIEFSHANAQNDPWGDNAETVDIFKRFIAHYLSEPGHPASPDGVIDALLDDELKANAKDPVLRPKLLLSVLTGSTLLPIDPNWKLKCLITHDWNEEFPRTAADGSEDYGDDVQVFFRACFHTFSITNNARLRLLLLCEIPEAGNDTEFGRFFHGQLLSSRQQFTAV